MITSRYIRLNLYPYLMMTLHYVGVNVCPSLMITLIGSDRCPLWWWRYITSLPDDILRFVFAESLMFVDSILWKLRTMAAACTESTYVSYKPAARPSSALSQPYPTTLTHGATIRVYHISCAACVYRFDPTPSGAMCRGRHWVADPPCTSCPW